MKHKSMLQSPPKYLVEGRWVGSVHHAYTIAVQHGYNGCEVMIGVRLRKGASTWAELSAPVDARISKRNRAVRLAQLGNAHAAVVDAIAALDARKREIAQRQREENEKEEDNDG